MKFIFWIPFIFDVENWLKVRVLHILTNQNTMIFLLESWFLAKKTLLILYPSLENSSTLITIMLTYERTSKMSRFDLMNAAIQSLNCFHYIQVRFVLCVELLSIFVFMQLWNHKFIHVQGQVSWIEELTLNMLLGVGIKFT